LTLLTILIFFSGALMNRQIQVWLKGNLVNRRALARRTLSLVLALVLMGISSPLSAQAAPPVREADEMTYSFRLKAEQESDYPGEICVGDPVIFAITAWESGQDFSTNTTIAPHQISGFKVNANILQPDLLKIKSQNPAGLTWADDPLMAAEFTFKGVKAGTAQISFSANVPAIILSSAARKRIPPADLNKMLAVTVTAQVDVIDCPFNVSLVDRNEINAGPAGRVISVGLMDKTPLKASDAEGKIFSAQRNVQVIVIEIHPDSDCAVTISVGSRSIQVAAEKLENDNYKVGYEEGPMTFSATYSCPGAEEENLGLLFKPYQPTDFTVGAKDVFFKNSYKVQSAGYLISSEMTVTRHRK
jgi:hypothetical protein